MVVRNGVAYANDAARAHVKVNINMHDRSSGILMLLTGRDCLWRPVPGFTD